VPRPEFVDTLTLEDVLDFLNSRVAKWWVPDEVVFLKEIPKTSVGKFNKKELRRTVLPEILKASGFQQGPG